MIMKKTTTQRLILTAVLAALTCAATLLHIPTVNGYANLGDCLVLVCAWTLGPVYGTLAAAIGSALADIILSYVIYAPATFVIKGLMALSAYFVCLLLSKPLKLPDVVSRILGAITAEIIMILGYFAFECILYGAGGALASILTNAMQGAVGAIGGVILYNVLLRSRLLKNLHM